MGYSELFSLSREDVLAAMKDYPEAQEILRNLGTKRLMEAQRVARAYRMPPSPGHDSSDNSTGKKRIVDKLKSEAKGIKNAMRKSRRSARPEESLELQPLTPKVPPLRRQTKVDDCQETSASTIEPPISPLGAGLPLLSRLRLLKEKQDREEKRTLVEVPSQPHEPAAPAPEPLNPMNQNLPLLQRILLLKAKPEPETVVDNEAPAKEPLLPKKTFVEEAAGTGHHKLQPSITIVENVVKSPALSIENGNSSTAKKPWAMLKDASLTAKDLASPQRSPPARKPQLKQSLVHIRQQTKMYASVDDLSPEYCGLPFVKKLKILNERQKLAELERAVRSSSLDCGENAEAEFDGNLTRSHSEACAIEYARKLAKFNQVIQFHYSRSTNALVHCVTVISTWSGNLSSSHFYPVSNNRKHHSERRFITIK